MSACWRLIFRIIEAFKPGMHVRFKRAAVMFAFWSLELLQFCALGQSTSMVWDASSGRPLTYTNQNGVVSYVAFSPDGKSIVGYTGNHVRIWQIRSILRHDWTVRVMKSAFGLRVYESNLSAGIYFFVWNGTEHKIQSVRSLAIATELLAIFMLAMAAWWLHRRSGRKIRWDKPASV